MNAEVSKMKSKNRVIQSLLAIFSVTVIFFGTAIAEEYNGSTPSENLALKSPAVSVSVPIASAVLAQAIAPSSYCFKCLPSPRLVFNGKKDFTDHGGVAYTQYNLTVANRDDYPASLFKPAPDLPPCGLNKNSARTWVDIYNLEGSLLNSFCDLSSPSNLNGIWFAIPKGKTPPKSVYITLNDRRCKIILKSNLVTIS